MVVSFTAVWTMEGADGLWGGGGGGRKKAVWGQGKERRIQPSVWDRLSLSHQREAAQSMAWFLMLRKEISTGDVNLEEINIEDKNLRKGWNCPGKVYRIRIEGDPRHTLKEHQYLKDGEIQKSPQRRLRGIQSSRKKTRRWRCDRSYKNILQEEIGHQCHILLRGENGTWKVSTGLSNTELWPW